MISLRVSFQVMFIPMNPWWCFSVGISYTRINQVFDSCSYVTALAPSLDRSLFCCEFCLCSLWSTTELMEFAHVPINDTAALSLDRWLDRSDCKSSAMWWRQGFHSSRQFWPQVEHLRTSSVSPFPARNVAKNNFYPSHWIGSLSDHV